jgi:sugar-specific transcriptional regulator TrmB
MQVNTGIEALRELGFTELESRIYIFLLEESPATGYRIAQAIEKPVANTYKAIELLEHKGALIIEGGNKRLCRAVPLQEILKQLELSFNSSRKKAERVLSRIKPHKSDGRVYRIKSKNLVMQRCRSMLKRSRYIAILDAFPKPLEELLPEINKTAARGVKMNIKAYRDIELNDVEVVVDFRGEHLIKDWLGQWINLVVDANEFLLAFLTSDGLGVHQAVWSGSPYLSWLYHCGIISEITVDRINRVLDSEGTIDQIRDIIINCRPKKTRELLGYKNLLDRFS